MSKMIVKTEGETHVVVIRPFAAPPEDVFRAFTDPKLMQKWMLGPEGWTMPVCVSEPQPGGTIRCEWSDGKGNSCRISGEYVAVEPYSRIQHVERMFMPDQTPDNHIETRFDAQGDGTLVTMRMTLPDAEARAAMLASGAEYGMEAGYVRMDEMLVSGLPKA